MLIVQIKNGNIEKGLKELKGKFIKTKVGKECKDREEYLKESVRKREEKIKAIYNQKKREQNN
jgi:small subunit ribosomal protein S21